MAKTLSNFDFQAVPRGGRPPKYPWGEWFDGNTYLLIQGTTDDADFQPGPMDKGQVTNDRARRFIGSARQALNDEGLGDTHTLEAVTANDKGEFDPSGSHIILRARKMTKEEAEKKQAANEKRKATMRATGTKPGRPKGSGAGADASTTGATKG